MYKFIPMTLLLLSLCGCAGPFAQKDVPPGATSTQSTRQTDNACLGDPDIPAEMRGLFETVEDRQLLESALGPPEGGMLCQGKVYRVRKDAEVTIYRAWNSTNPKSRLGKWWAFSRPQGSVARYRQGFEICYQWSSLDKLTRCSLKPGSTVVVGTGQSAECSEYLEYPASAAKQIYIAEAPSSVARCSDYDALFSWQPVRER